jgi:hypothetical protein
MKAERFRRTGAVAATGVVALLVAALTFGVSSAVLRPAVSPLTAPSGTAFTVTTAIYPSPACSGSTVRLYPGVTDCAVLTVHNNLTVPINVQNLTATVSSSPTGCPASSFSLPAFSGTLSVGAGANVSTSGLPVSLIDTRTNQDACQGATVDLAYTGSAEFTDATSTGLVASSASPASPQLVTLRATVTGANAASDPAAPTGTVSFRSCPTSACSSTTALGTATIDPGGVATLTTTGLTTGVRYLEAAYAGLGTDYTGSTSPVLTLSVGAAISSSASASSGSGTTSGAKTAPSAASIAFTGADIAGMVVVALLLIGSGTFVVITARRKRRSSGS